MSEIESHEVIVRILGPVPEWCEGEIVRCRDCMYYQHNSFHRCDLYSISHEVEPDGFCAWASRKEVYV